MSIRIKKTLAGIAGVGLVVMLLLFVNSFLGNPLSNLLARRAAQQYIDTNYSGLDMRIQSCGYNFKFGVYYAFVQSGTSVDTAFSVHVNSFGKVLDDEYEYEVANNFTTFRRLDAELRALAEEVIGGALDYDFEHISLPFVKEGDLMALTLDMELDIHNPPLPLEADVTLFSEDLSYGKIAEVAKAVEAVLREQDIPVREYSIRIIPLSDKPKGEGQAATWANALSISYFPADRMGEEDLPQVMERYETERVEKVNQTDKK